MRERNPLFLMLSVVLLLVGVDFLLLQNDKGALGVDDRLVDADFSPVRIVLSRGGVTNAVLERLDFNWRISAPYIASADSQTVLKFFDAILFAAPIDLASEAELAKIGRRTEDYLLKDPVLTVELESEKEKRVISFGRTTPAADGVYATVAGLKSVFLVPIESYSAIDLPLEKFRCRSLFQASPESILSFNIRSNPKDSISFTRIGNSWKVGDKNGSSGVIGDFLLKMLGAQADAFVWPVGGSNETEHISSALLAGYGLDHDSAVSLSFKCTDGRDQQVSFGKKSDDKHVYALAHNGTAVVQAPLALRDLAAQPLASFIDRHLIRIEQEEISSIHLVDGKDSCALSRSDDRTWRVDVPIAAPANASAVNEFLTKALSLNEEDAVEKGVSVTFSGMERPIVTTRQKLGLEAGFGSFRSIEMIRVEPRRLLRLSASRDGQASAVEAIAYDAEQDAWRPDGMEDAGVVNMDSVRELLALLSSVRASRVVTLKASTAELSAFGLEHPTFVLAVDQRDQSTLRQNIIVGSSCDDDGWYATIGSSDAVFVITDETLQILKSPLVTR